MSVALLKVDYGRTFDYPSLSFLLASLFVTTSLNALSYFGWRATIDLEIYALPFTLIVCIVVYTQSVLGSSKNDGEGVKEIESSINLSPSGL